MACHTPLLKKSRNKGNDITQPQSHPFKNAEFWDGMGLRLGNTISHSSFTGCASTKQRCIAPGFNANYVQAQTGPSWFAGYGFAWSGNKANSHFNA